MAEETLMPPVDTTVDTTTAKSPAVPEAATEFVAQEEQDSGAASTVMPATDTATTPEPATAAVPIEGATDEKQGEPVVTVGRIVHVVLDRGTNTGDCRPAIVVRVWNPETINAQMFTDGLNDHMDYASGMAWLTSLRYAKPVAGQAPPPRTWHWSWED